LLSDALAAYDWALDRYRTDGTPQVLSNSWGIYQQSWIPDYACDANHPFTRKVVEVIDAGMLVVFAAGNCGQVCPSSRCGGDNGPGKSIWGANGHPRVITVGAVNVHDEWVGYSSQGPSCMSEQKPDICGISHFKGYTAVDNGTSAACPTIAGVLGLLSEASPGLTQDAAMNALTSTARNMCAPGWDNHSGAGVVDANAARLALAKTGKTAVKAS
jgi:subtilisin family serine protease